MARAERSALCDLALQLGEDHPTLCGAWTVKDLVVHLLVREGNVAAAGIVVPQLARVTDLASRRLARQEFPLLVERLRNGPPVYSPYRVPRLDRMFNTLEFFVHHEDVRRARPEWRARPLADRQQRTLWKMVGTAAKGLLRKADVGVVLERSDTGERVTPTRGDGEVVVRGLPGELVMFAFGREQAEVEYHGAPEHVATLKATSLGV